MAQEHVEEYLEAIYDIAGSGGTAKTNAIAKCLKVAPASVTGELQSLFEKNLIHYEPYRGASLAETGRVIAEKIKRRHRLLEVFLTDVLKIRHENVHDEACRMEHAISAETECALCKMLEAPSRCPHGSPISPCDKSITHCADCRTASETADAPATREWEIVPVTDLGPAGRGTIAFIRGDHKIVKRLCEIGLKPGTMVSVMRTSPSDAPIELLVRRKRHVIDHGIADDIFVKSFITGEP